jgi:hypothetical protein
MPTDKHFSVIELRALSWPGSEQVPEHRFRLLVAADTVELDVEVISSFANQALQAGMVYFCAWGRDSVISIR